MKSFTKGGQLIRHNILMFRQVSRDSAFYACGVSFILTMIVAFYNPPVIRPENVSLYAYANIRNYIDHTACDLGKSLMSSHKCFPSEIHLNNGQTVYPQSVLTDMRIRRDIANLKMFGYRISISAISLWLTSFIVIAWFCTRYGKLNSSSKESYIKTAAEVKKYLKKTNQCGSIVVGGMPLIKNSEPKHIIALGSTGSGKTNLIKTISDQVRKLNQPAIVLDLTGEMIAKYYDEKKGDIIFNPSDQRCWGWDVKKELELEEKLNLFASSLFSGKMSSDDFWPDTAKQAFIDIFTKVVLVEQKSIKELHNKLTRASIEELSDIVKGTDSQNLIDKKNYKTTRIILQHIISCVGWLSKVDVANKNSFSIESFCKDAANSNRGRWLFFSSPRSARDLFHVFYNIVLNLAKDAIIDLSPSSDRRIWLIIDELASFKDLRVLEECVAELRKYGGCVLTATQSINQLNALYTAEVARTIFDQFNTKFLFKSNIDQQILSNCLGVVEVEKCHESVSYGAHEMRDGVNISKSKVTKPLLSSAQISALNPLECYAILPDSNIKCAKIKVPFVG